MGDGPKWRIFTLDLEKRIWADDPLRVTRSPIRQLKSLTVMFDKLYCRLAGLDPAGSD